jgi:hypothetical protein
MASTRGSSEAHQQAGSANFAQRLQRDGRERLESGKFSAADRIEAIAGAIDAAAARLESEQPAMAGYASRLASGIGSVASRLRDGSLDDLVTQTRHFATRHPALFLSGGFLLGVALSRFIKAAPTVAGGSQSSDPLVSSQIVTSTDSQSGHDASPGGNARSTYPTGEV